MDGIAHKRKGLGFPGAMCGYREVRIYDREPPVQEIKRTDAKLVTENITTFKQRPWSTRLPARLARFKRGKTKAPVPKVRGLLHPLCKQPCLLGPYYTHTRTFVKGVFEFKKEARDIR
ncbi:soluble lytic murein transglycosylase and related regulatory proteins [Moorella thermoacetica Y72]|uniref:Soluble lytic murein transglycosylase and related regulatory proteins n=1 Tax=Moorella thermoacetica Y72 TaxID=1325331 RepID=A0A0S6UGI0_NEOTH|nr:hypothetical protein [Moorella thermoacetica]GAF27080.1 soluble lytic murein transglycosylase and related regulatory proteins [Moorella thermoacetica Y72]